MKNASSKLLEAVSSNPYRWTWRTQANATVIFLLAAALIGWFKVTLRYDPSESERWWWFYFTEQLMSWGQWLIWAPALILVFQRTLANVKSQWGSYLMSFIALFTVGVLASSIEGFLWHFFRNTRVEWPWPRVWKAFISNKFAFHFLVGSTVTLLLVARALWLLIKEKKQGNGISIRLDGENKSGSLAIKQKGRTDFLPLAEITHLCASGSYVEIFTATGKTVVTGTLKNFMTKLPDTFVRIHRSYIVRIDAVRTIAPLTNDDYKVITSTGYELRLSRNYKESLVRLQGNATPSYLPTN